MERTELLYVVSGLLFLTVFGVYLTLKDFTVGLILTIISVIWALSIYIFMVKFWKEESSE
ncbi:hypothetical protein L3N51_01988 [Metallosphaera sp. J1]|uniref:hypothetical protein n=1 Tax=Metallosphaera TaxID=41980 RepID=UPI001EE0FBB6|nr:hypothetical protein [Metallosphaera javensis (ex Hofmann et al. 2022)]MCG3109693.1 hypothetical protein [Metallosphaera javensis (ex Hofmann et al. 2022)]BCS93760.1 MAG: hypothetical protein MjAS7_2368 [Metallosphaera javensis (ex Sakai et al. 2022)]